MDQGSLFDYMEKRQHNRLTEPEIIGIFLQIAKGVKALHSMNPPHAHRDLKIENVLFDGKTFKLCDFGSVSADVVDFAYFYTLSRTLPRELHHTKIEEFEKRTTITYRAPEMCDPFLRFKVDQKVDIWMLGCILFALAFYKHPFQECSTLSIANASYFLPKKHNYSNKLENLIRNLLTPNPAERMNIQELLDLLMKYPMIHELPLTVC